MADTIDDPSMRLTAEEQLVLYHVERGLPYRPESRAPEAAPVDPRFEVWEEDIDTLEVALSSSLDASVRGAEMDELMAPFGRGGPWFGAPNAVRKQSERRVLDSQDQRSGERLAALEELLMTLGPDIEAAFADAQRAEDPVAEAVRNGYDPMASGQLVETRRLRREPYLHRSLPSARAKVYQDNPRTVEALVDNEIIEAMFDNHEGPATANPREIAANEQLRRRILAAREARIPAQARRLMETLATARRVASRARQLHRIVPARPKPEARRKEK